MLEISFCTQPFSAEQNLTGSVYQQSKWQECDVTLKRSVYNNKINCYINFVYTNKHLFKEVDLLR